VEILSSYISTPPRLFPLIRFDYSEMIFITSSKKVMFSSWFVCLQLRTKTSERICMKFSGNVDSGPVNKIMIEFWLRSGSWIHPDPDPYRDTSKTCLGGGMHCPSSSNFLGFFWTHLHVRQPSVKNDLLVKHQHSLRQSYSILEMDGSNFPPASTYRSFYFSLLLHFKLLFSTFPG